MIDTQGWKEILQDLEELQMLHEETLTSSSKCREFNSHSALLLQKLEDMGCSRIADLVMDLMGGCSPKDLSHCDNHDRTKGMLERIKERIKENIF